MELADDGDLLKKIDSHKKAKTRFRESDIWSYLTQILSGLSLLHNMKIYHRDLKSANLFMSKPNLMKIGDLNVSKVAKKGMLYTQTGTPYYASPEVWKDKPYDSRSDIWSLGCVIYEMVALQPPFKASDMKGLYSKVIKGQYLPIPDSFSKDLEGFIRQML
jgi:NIMA (never in mitosis gene a)-related kinase